MSVIDASSIVAVALGGTATTPTTSSFRLILTNPPVGITPPGGASTGDPRGAIRVGVAGPAGLDARHADGGLQHAGAGFDRRGNRPLQVALATVINPGAADRRGDGLKGFMRGRSDRECRARGVVYAGEGLRPAQDLQGQQAFAQQPRSSLKRGSGPLFRSAAVASRRRFKEHEGDEEEGARRRRPVERSLAAAPSQHGPRRPQAAA